MPWSGGLVALLWISLATYFVIEVLQIENKWQMAIVSGIMSTNITLITLVASYGHDVGPDAMALLLATIGCWLWMKQCEDISTKKKVLFGLLVAVALAVMLGLYQAYICVYVSLVLMCLIQELLQNTQRGQWLKAFIRGLLAAVPVVVGGILYYIGLVVVNNVTDTSVSVGKANSLTNLWNNEEGIYVRILRTYYQIKGLFMDMPGYVYPDSHIQTINKVLLLGGLLALIAIIVKLIKTKIGLMNILSIIVLLIALPFTMNGMRMLNPLVHDLMTYACWFTYIIVFLLSIEMGKHYKICFDKIVAVLLCLVILFNVQVANTAYTKKSADKEATLSVMTRVIDRIESLEGYEEGLTPVLFIGEPNDYLQSYESYTEIETLTGMNNNSAVTYYGTYSYYLKKIMRVDMNVINLEQGLETVSDEAKTMQIFPAQGSVAMINGIVVVKFEEIS